MTNHSTNGSPIEAASIAPSVELFYVITLLYALPLGMAYSHVTGTVTTAGPPNRDRAFQYVYDLACSEQSKRDAAVRGLRPTVVFFSLEPNRMAVAVA